MKKRIYNHLFEIEREDKNLFYNRFLEKSDDAFLEELRKNFIDVERQARRKKLMGNGSGVKGAPKISGEKTENQPVVFEKKIEKRVRFKNEKKVASYLLNNEFEKANDIIRDYIRDFNFKIITATIEVLQAKAKGEGAKVDYQGFQVHHIDNYARYSKDSMLESILDTVKVEDYVEKKAGTPNTTKSPGDKEDKVKNPGKTPRVEPGKEKKDNASK